MLTRRAFFQSLAASVVTVGMPLPVGFPRGLAWADKMTAAPPSQDFMDLLERKMKVAEERLSAEFARNLWGDGTCDRPDGLAGLLT